MLQGFGFRRLDDDFNVFHLFDSHGVAQIAFEVGPVGDDQTRAQPVLQFLPQGFECFFHFTIQSEERCMHQRNVPNEVKGRNGRARSLRSSSLHDLDLVRREAVQFVHQIVDLAVGGLNLTFEAFLFVGQPGGG